MEPSDRSSMAPRRKIILWNILAPLLGLVPIALFWMSIGRVASVGADAARADLAQNPSTVVLLDVRAAERSAAKPIPGAVTVPLETLQAMTGAAELPAGVSGKRLLVICDTGRKAALAVRRLRAWGLSDAWRISGGLESWQARGDGKTSTAPAAVLRTSPFSAGA